MNLLATIAVAALAAGFPSSSSAFLYQTKDVSFVVSTLQHQYARESFSELDKLKSKRLSIRRHPPEQTDVAVEGGVVDSSSDLVLEYLYETEEERHSDDLCHILLMPSTFHKISIEHATEACSEILGLESEKAYGMSIFAKHQGFSTLGTWTHEECISMGKELSSRDLDCRIVPFNGGGSSHVVSKEIDIPIENKYIPIQRRLSWESRCLPLLIEDIDNESTETIIEEFYFYA